jgi:hypothetical protein
LDRLLRFGPVPRFVAFLGTPANLERELDSHEIALVANPAPHRKLQLNQADEVPPSRTGGSEMARTAKPASEHRLQSL